MPSHDNRELAPDRARHPAQVYSLSQNKLIGVAALARALDWRPAVARIDAAAQHSGETL